jgi:tetratricopeptide (TPR) repeat protein
LFCFVFFFSSYLIAAPKKSFHKHIPIETRECPPRRADDPDDASIFFFFAGLFFFFFFFFLIYIYIYAQPPGSSEFRAAWAHTSRDVGWWFRVGSLLRQVGHAREGIAALAIGVQCADDDKLAAALVNLGVAIKAGGNLRQALALYELALSYAPPPEFRAALAWGVFLLLLLLLLFLSFCLSMRFHTRFLF